MITEEKKESIKFAVIIGIAIIAAVILLLTKGWSLAIAGGVNSFFIGGMILLYIDSLKTKSEIYFEKTNAGLAIYAILITVCSVIVWRLW